ncbi:MAG: DUF4258 domain-containing protein [Parachlamydiaceae bacterium]
MTIDRSTISSSRLCCDARYRESRHARIRQEERCIDLPDVLFVLKNGYHEKRKSSFDEVFQVWKYAIRGSTLDGIDIRIIVSFDDDGMLIITVMHVVKFGDV